MVSVPAGSDLIDYIFQFPSQGAYLGDPLIQAYTPFAQGQTSVALLVYNPVETVQAPLPATGNPLVSLPQLSVSSVALSGFWAMLTIQGGVIPDFQNHPNIQIINDRTLGVLQSAIDVTHVNVIINNIGVYATDGMRNKLALNNVATSATFIITSTPIFLSPAITVVGGRTLATAMVSISATLFSGDLLSATTTGTAISASYSSSTGVLSLIGIDTIGNYQKVLQSVTYFSPSADPTNSGADLNRTIAWSVSDGKNSSPTQITTLSFSHGFPAVTGPVSSAGIYDSTGLLVRTLWSAVTNAPNVMNPVASWNGVNDDGTTAASGTYTVKRLTHNCGYNWDGVAFNSSSDHTTMFYHNWFYPIQGMALTSTEIYFFTQSSERWSTMQVATVANPQFTRPVTPNTFRTAYPGSVAVATDGINAYFGQAQPGNSMVVAVGCADGTENFLTKKSPVVFSSGDSFTLGVFTKVAGLDNTANQLITGLAVQQSGNFLYYSEQFQPSVRTMNKTTGATLKINTSIVSPAGMCINPNDDSLWLIHGATPVIDRYTADGAGNLSASGITVSSLTKPLALAISPDGTTLLVCDGATHQVYAFNTSDGSTKTAFGTNGVFGRLNGYVNNPNVTNTAFWFTNQETLGNAQCFIAFGTDGSWWLGDIGNYRSLHFSSGNSPTFIEQIVFMPAFYELATIRGDPTRILANFLEFQIDYTKAVNPNLGAWPNNGSWTLTKNWKGNLAPSLFLDIFGYTPTQQYDYIRNNIVPKLGMGLVASNGRTYAFGFISNSDMRVFELNPNTGLRLCLSGNSIGAVPQTHSYIDSNFNQWFQESMGPGQVANIWMNQFIGFDGNNDPTWADQNNAGQPPTQGKGLIQYTTQTLPTLFPINSAIDITYKHSELTASGYLIVYTGGSNNDSTLYNLAAIEPVSGKVKWMTHPGALTYTINAAGNYGGIPPVSIHYLQYTEAPYFAQGGGPNMGGPLHYNAGDTNIFTRQRGEDWGNNQLNVNHHWDDSGLLVNRFGAGAPSGPTVGGPFVGGGDPASVSTLDPAGLGAQPYPVASSPYSWKALGGFAGNSNSGAMTKVNGVYYLYQNDEWYHGGIHRWSITNTSSIQVSSFPVNWSSGVLPSNPLNLLHDLPYNTIGVADGTQGWHRNPTTDIFDAGPSYRWSIFTNAINNSRFDPDIALLNRDNGVTRTLSRDIPSGGTGDWTLSGNFLVYPGLISSSPFSIDGTIYHDILDNNGKVIVRHYAGLDSVSSNGLWYVNDILVASPLNAPNAVFTYNAESQSPFSIVGHVGSGTFNLVWGRYSATVTGVYQAGADITKPTTFKLTTVGEGGNYICFTVLNWSRPT